MRTSLLLSALAISTPAQAEGQAELGVQTLGAESVLYVDIINATSETFRFTGVGTIDVVAPDGTAVGTFGSGDVVTPGQTGAYVVTLSNDQIGVWDIEVIGAVREGGRLSSYHWYLNGRSYRESSSFTGSFYALVPAGREGHDQTIEMQCDGLTGNIWEMSANGTGVDGISAGRSVSSVGHTYDDSFPIYLNPPTVAQNNPVQPSVGDPSWTVLGACEGQVVTGGASAVLTFGSDVAGTYHVVCDINGDGAFDVASARDAAISGAAVVGSNEVTWDGTDNGGEPVTGGVYECIVILTVGEYHYIANDIETSFEGLRLFSLDTELNRTGVRMYWNDKLLPDLQATMPDGQDPLTSAGPTGLDPGAYTDEVAPNVNARSWGAFSEESKGDDALLDTFGWIASTESATFELSVANTVIDRDADGLYDPQEDCIWGTDPTNPDTDGDGLLDGDEAISRGTDPLNTDTDADGLADGDEVALGTNPLDVDSDRDSVLDGEEATDATNAPDTDGDLTIDALDIDDDDDGILTSSEAAWEDADVDTDGEPNWRDTDADGDGIDDAVEGDVDVDENGIPDYLDPLYPIGPPLEQWYVGGGCATVGGGSARGVATVAALGALALLAGRRRRLR